MLSAAIAPSANALEMRPVTEPVMVSEAEACLIEVGRLNIEAGVGMFFELPHEDSPGYFNEMSRLTKIFAKVDTKLEECKPLVHLSDRSETVEMNEMLPYGYVMMQIGNMKDMATLSGKREIVHRFAMSIFSEHRQAIGEAPTAAETEENEALWGEVTKQGELLQTELNTQMRMFQEVALWLSLHEMIAEDKRRSLTTTPD